MKRRVGSVMAVIGLAVALSAVAAVAVGRSPEPASGSSPAPAGSGNSLAGNITKLQDALRRQPQDYVGWASLGLDYVAQAKISVDPSYYPKADGALARSLSINSTENFTAMAGMAALKAGEHHFAAAQMWDAETQLGHYDEAARAAQQLNNLQPGVAAFSRASYVFELHGDLANARATMTRALADATNPADRAFAHYYLGELAFTSGDPATALAENEAGLAADPSSSACRQGKARAEAALGNTDAAVRDYLQVVGEVPQPQYLIEAGELLASLGREREAQQQYAVFGAEVELFQANGVTLDTDPTLFYADHGDPQLALRFGAAGLAIRPFMEMEDAYAWALHVNGQRHRGAGARARRDGAGHPQRAVLLPRRDDREVARATGGGHH